MSLLPIIIFFVLGTIIGSFLNVVILRLRTARSLGGRSACMSCESKLCWYELIPLFSFVGLRGRCRTCKTKISIQYPLVELATGLIFAALFVKFESICSLSLSIFIFTYLYYVMMFSLLVVIAVYDLKHKIIPDMLALIFGVLAFLGMFVFSSYNPFVFMPMIFFPHVPSIFEFLNGFLVAFPFAFFWVISAGRWMGLGDAKLAIGLGWLLGSYLAFSSLLVAFWSGAIVGVTLILLSKLSTSRRNYGMKTEIPFAPFLVFGAIITFLFELNFFNF